MKHIKKIKIDSGVPPYSYTWSSNTPCFTFNKVTGTTENGEVDVIINVDSENCYNDSNFIKIDAVDSLGCKNDKNFKLTNPCTNYLQPSINNNGFKNGVYTYVATGVGGNGPYTYSWSYPTTIFKVVGSSTENVLKLALLNNAPYQFDFPYPIRVTVKDASECSKTTTTFKVFCKPTTTNFSTQGGCNGCGPGSVRLSIDFTQYVTSCVTTKINWDTLNIITDYASLDGTYSVTNTNGDVVICVDVFALANAGYDLLTNNNIIVFKYFVKDDDGVLSSVGEFVANIPDCLSGKISKCLTTFPYILTTNCNWTLPKDVTIPLTSTTNSLIIPGSAAIDWNTFTFIESTGQNLINNRKLELTNPDEYAELNVNNEIVVHIEDLTTPTSNSELIRWKVCDFNNCCSSSTSTIVEMTCLTPPTVTNKSFCLACGAQQIFDLVAGATGGSISTNSTINITEPPTMGYVTISNLVVNYLAFPNIYGTDTLKYTITDDNGLTSNEGTVTITVTCPGVPGSEITCNE